MNNLPDEKFLEQLGKRVAVFILLAAFMIICIMLYRIFTLPGHPPRAIPDYQKAKIEKYCKERGVRPRVVEINSNGRMFYWLDDGQKCEIKG